jgi:hypothetical protein
MKSVKITILITIIFSIVFFFTGLFNYDSFLSLALPTDGNIKYITTNFTDSFKQPFYFGLTLAFFPIATVFLWRITPISTMSKKMLTIGILFVFMLSFIIVRREMIKSQASYLLPTTLNIEKIESSIPLSSVNFELFAISGLVAGSFVSFFSMRQNKKSTSSKA